MFLNLFAFVFRALVFTFASLAAALLILASSGVLFTAFKWWTQSELAAAISLLLACAVCGGMNWRLQSRRAQAAKRKVDTTKIATWSGLATLAFVTVGWGMSYFPVTGPLTVLCLRPLGSLATPMLIEALQDHEAGSEADDLLEFYPDAVARSLPRLQRILREDRGGSYSATALVTQLGPKAAAAAPEMIGLLRHDVAESDEAAFVRRYENFDPKYKASHPWTALVAMGDGAIPALVEALKKSTDSREQMALACILRYRGENAAPAVESLMAILEGESEDAVKVECRRAAISALAAIGPKAAPAIDTLKNWARDLRSPYSGDAISALGDIGPPQPDVVNVLIAITDEEGAFDNLSTNTRGHKAIEALGQLGPKAMSAVPKLVQLMTKHPSLDLICLTALAKMGPDGMLQAAAMLIGEKEAYAAYALEEAGPAVKQVLPLLRKGMELAAPEDRVMYATAIERISGPSDPILIGMAEGMVRPGLNEKLNFRSIDQDIWGRLWDLGEKAKVVAPVLKKAIANREIYNRIHLARLLWKIDRDPAAVLPVIVDDLQSKNPHLDYGYEAEWLVEVDPSGETIVPALANYVAAQEYPMPAMEAFTLYGSRARAALPEIRRAVLEDRLYESWFETYLFSVSPVEFFLFTLTGRVLSVMIGAFLCFLIECFYFRWRLVPRKIKTQCRRESSRIRLPLSY